jgi:hypothetical protein
MSIMARRRRRRYTLRSSGNCSAMARTGGNPVSAASLEYEYWYGVSADLPNRTAGY